MVHRLACVVIAAVGLIACGGEDVACLDSDADGFGLGCMSGLDCDDSDPDVSVCMDAAILTWTAPTENLDGSPLDNLMGYRVHIGTESGVYASNDDIGLPTCGVIGGATECTHTVRGFDSGTRFFVVSAYNSLGAESPVSNEVSKTFP